MSTTYRSRAADQRVADDTIADRSLMCVAQGCPNRWSVDKGSGRLCSAHAWSDPMLWPRITQELLDTETARACAVPQPKPDTPPLSVPQKIALLQKLRRVRLDGGDRDKRAWARALKAREDGGERLSAAVRQMWRDALGLASENLNEGETA